MGDFGSPVAQNVAGPQQGVQTLSALMGLKQQQLSIAQQQLGLQQQQQQLSSQTSEATQAAIHTQNTQALQGIDWRQFDTPNGYDIQGATDAATKAGGVDAPAFVSRLADMTQAGAVAKKSLLQLNQDYQGPVRNAFGLFGGDPKMSVSDLATQLEQISQTAPPDQKASIDKIMKSTFGLITGPNLFTGQPKSDQQQRAEALQYSRAGSENQVAALTTPQVGTVSTGGSVAPVSQTPLNPALKVAPGALPTTIAPQIVTQPGTGARYIAWGNGAVTPLGAPGAPGAPPQPNAPAAPGAPAGAPQSAGGASGGTNWWQPAPGQVQYLHGQTQALVARVQAGQSAANTAPTAIDALTRAAAILDKNTWTGGAFSAFKDLKNLAASVGADTASAQNASELAKNLARYEAARAGSVGDTDAARSLYESGAPNTKMDPAAVKAVIFQSLGIERMIQGYAKVVGGTQTPLDGMKAEQQFRSVPHLVQTYELGFMRNKQEADELCKRYGVSLSELAKSAQQLKAMGAM